MQVLYSIAMDEEKRIKDQLAVLEDQHRQLDRRIVDFSAQVNMLELQRLKKQKLFLKDQIAILKSYLLPDATA